MKRYESGALFLAFLGMALPVSARAQQATSVFEQFSNAVAKVEVVEAISETPSSVGTAFYVGPNLLLTNYHVVRDVVFRSEDYAVRVESEDLGALPDVRLAGLDIVNDLALLHTSQTHPNPLVLVAEEVPIGEVLYSLGHPWDLRTSVVEGVFNGSVEASVATRYHFSGSINPGMSGGPTVRVDGAVVGINVSTGGDQISFLVPADRALALLEEAEEIDEPTVDELLDLANGRLDEFQDAFFTGLDSGGLENRRIGRIDMLSPAEGILDCSADTEDVDDDQYQVVEYRCSSEDWLLLGGESDQVLFFLGHEWIAGPELNRLAFSNLVNSRQGLWAGENEDATTFRCENGNTVNSHGMEALVAFCVRGHLPHENLYDLVAQVTLNTGEKETVVSSLRASPISMENARSLFHAWVEGFRWVP